MSWVSCIIVVAAIAHISYSQSPVHLTTTKGPIVGVRWNPNPNSLVSYDAFIGIPYGQIPARFQPPVARSSWSTPIYTQQDGPVCPQPNAAYEEDCLFLNVYTPLNASSTPGTFPVVAFIHGSAFTVGSSSSKFFGPDFIVPKGVILVTMNYRLGAAGFLTLGSSLAPGNLGLLDTRLALEWIQKEISTFGGDPKQVTLAGHSAGSVMTTYHYLSNTSSALFQRAIAHSGSALSTWGHVTAAEAVRRAKLLADAVGCKSSANDSQLLTCLQSVNISSIVKYQNIGISIEDNASGNQLPFVPVIDTQFGQPPFFPGNFGYLINEAGKRSKPLIAGFTTEEAIFLLAMSDIWKAAESNLKGFATWRMEGSVSDQQKAAMAQLIAEKYFPKNAPDDNKVLDVVKLYTDSMFAYPAIDLIKSLPNLTYGYVFGYNGGWNNLYQKMAQLHFTGVAHGDDMNYLFYSTQDLAKCSSNTPNLAVRDNLVKWWTDFVKTGIPDSSGLWSPVSKGYYLLMDSSLSAVNASEVESRYYDFWAKLPDNSRHSSASTTNFNLFLILITLLIIKFKSGF